MAAKVKESGVVASAALPASNEDRERALDLAIRMHGDVLVIHAGFQTTADDVLATADKIAKWLAGGDK